MCISFIPVDGYSDINKAYKLLRSQPLFPFSVKVKYTEKKTKQGKKSGSEGAGRHNLADTKKNTGVLLTVLNLTI